MTKRITITDTEYFKILELKGKYGESGLCGLLVLLDKLAGYAKEANIDKHPKQPDITIKPKQPKEPKQPNTSSLSYCDICGQESNNLKSVNYEDNDVLACELCLSDIDIKPYIKIIKKQNTNSERSPDIKNKSQK